MFPRRIAIAWVGLASTLAACSSNDRGRSQARRLLQTVSQSVKRLAGASRSFGEVVILRLEDKVTDGEMQQALDKFRALIIAQRDESNEWSVPKTDLAERLVTIYRANLDRRVALIDEYGPRIIDTLAKSGGPTTQKARAAREIFDELGGKADAAVAELRSATKRYAAEMGIFANQ